MASCQRTPVSPSYLRYSTGFSFVHEIQRALNYTLPLELEEEEEEEKKKKKKKEKKEEKEKQEQRILAQASTQSVDALPPISRDAGPRSPRREEQGKLDAQALPHRPHPAVKKIGQSSETVSTGYYAKHSHSSSRYYAKHSHSSSVSSTSSSQSGASVSTVATSYSTHSSGVPELPVITKTRPTQYSCTLCCKSFPGVAELSAHKQASHVLSRTSKPTALVLSQPPQSKPPTDPLPLSPSPYRAWACGLCSALHYSLDEHINHVSYKCQRPREKWKFTNVIHGLLRQPHVSRAWCALLTKSCGPSVKSWPMFSWQHLLTNDRATATQLQTSLEQHGHRESAAEGLARHALQTSIWKYKQSPKLARLNTSLVTVPATKHHPESGKDALKQLTPPPLTPRAVSQPYPPPNPPIQIDPSKLRAVSASATCFVDRPLSMQIDMMLFELLDNTSYNRSGLDQRHPDLNARKI